MRMSSKRNTLWTMFIAMSVDQMRMMRWKTSVKQWLISDGTGGGLLVLPFVTICPTKVSLHQRQLQSSLQCAGREHSNIQPTRRNNTQPRYSVLRLSMCLSSTHLQLRRITQSFVMRPSSSMGRPRTTQSSTSTASTIRRSTQLLSHQSQHLRLRH
jgi:hypothetical protein